ncbi:hypothetical protein F1559_000345 [Cyanidiococcus yangmingshanensis]|uniref:Epithelial splicing regulatory protein 2 n=1 Tax=Cyanidiococcus yangmingshanensis TaxID=2690220 RepID=A0A7J7IJA4_9RHOD|nr:hypothetical protein F1559_000345 [Cyanidiococcus yangmingshanensis]
MASSLIDYWVFLDIQRLYGDRGESEIFRMVWLVSDRRAQVLDAKQLYVRQSLPTLRQRARSLLQPSDQGAERIVEALECDAEGRGGYPVLISNDIAVMYNLLDAIDELAAYVRQAFVQYERRFGMILPSKGSLMQLIYDLERHQQQQQVGSDQDAMIQNALELVFGKFYICTVRGNAHLGVFSRCQDMLARVAQEGNLPPPERLAWGAGSTLGSSRNGFAGSAPFTETGMAVASASWYGAPMSAPCVAMGIPSRTVQAGSQRERVYASNTYPMSGSAGLAHAAAVAPATPVTSPETVMANAVAPASPIGSVVRLRGLPWSATTRDVAEWIRQPPSKAAACADTSLLEDFVRRPLQILSGGIVFVYNHQGRKTGEVFVQFASPDDASRCLHKHEDRMGHRYIEVFLSSHQDMWNLLSRYEAKRVALGLGAPSSATAFAGGSLPRNGTRSESDARTVPADMLLPASSVAMGIPVRAAPNWTVGGTTARTESLSRSPPEGNTVAAQPVSGPPSRGGSVDLMSPAHSPCLRLSGADATTSECDIERFVAPFQLDTTQGATILAYFALCGVKVPPNTTIPPVYTVRTANGGPSGEFMLVFQSVEERDRALTKTGQKLGVHPVVLSAISCFELAAALGILGITRTGV